MEVLACDGFARTSGLSIDFVRLMPGNVSADIKADSVKVWCPLVDSNY